MNLYDYVEKYKDISFEEKGFNEIENLVFSSLSYLDYEGIVSNTKKEISLKEAGNQYLKKYEYKDIFRLGIATKQAYKLLKKIVNTTRYSDILLSDYQYFGNNEVQFCAMKFKMNKQFIYISFEGTDHLISGWKEDFQLSYQFPVESQKYAIEYMNRHIRLLDRNIIVGGHSKGGNLALVASMYCQFLIRRKIKKIYSNDGPGLREEQIKSKNYQAIQNKLYQIIPNYSVVGLLLNQKDIDKIVLSTHKSILSHSMFTWKIKDDMLIEAPLSEISKRLKKSITIWLSNHNDDQRKKMIQTVFEALSLSGIHTLSDFISIKHAIKIIQAMKSIDLETKELMIHFLEFNISYMIKPK